MKTLPLNVEHYVLTCGAAQEATRRQPDNDMAYYVIATSQEALGNWGHGRRYFVTSIRAVLRPLPYFYYKLGDLYQDYGDRAKAMQSYRAASRLKTGLCAGRHQSVYSAARRTAVR